LRGRHVVVTEKLDGANVGIGFGERGELQLQSRWDRLENPPIEPALRSFVDWAAAAAPRLEPVLGTRYVLFGEWLGITHTLFYDALPDHFCGFDVLDRAEGVYLSAQPRADLLDAAGIAAPPVLHTGELGSLAELTALLGPSRYRTRHWRHALVDAVALAAGPTAGALAGVDGSELMEGLYLKVERAGRVLGRYKWVRPDFRSAVRDPRAHWLHRPLLRNGLRVR